MRKRFWILPPVLALIVVGFLAFLWASRGALFQSPPPPPTPAGPNALNAVAALHDGTVDMAGVRARLGELDQYTHYSYPGGEQGFAKAMAPKPTPLLAAPAAPATTPPVYPVVMTQFFHIQLVAKVSRVQAVFLLMQGKRTEALDLLVDLHRLGRLLADGNLLIARMIGVAVCAIAQGGLEMAVLNACESPEDYQECETVLASLAEAFHPVDAARIEALIQPPRLGIFMELFIGNKIRPSLDEVAIRHNITVARLRLIQLAAAGKHFLAVNGRFPEREADLAAFFPVGVPIDPLANAPAPVKWTVDPATGDLLCYSVGPDGVDDKAQTVYAQTTQLKSPGDIVLRVPREREIPFPRDGVHASTAAEVKALFPKGLPLDPFAQQSGASLHLSETTPVYLYSHGPSQQPPPVTVPTDPYTPTIAYDPTNGIVSPGDLFLRLPE